MRAELPCQADYGRESGILFVLMLICPDEADSSGLAAKGQAARQIENWMRDANHDNVKLWLVP
jgi:hypothetical protein